jgi:hypothetical protein
VGEHSTGTSGRSNYNKLYPKLEKEDRDIRLVLQAGTSHLATSGGEDTLEEQDNGEDKEMLKEINELDKHYQQQEGTNYINTSRVKDNIMLNT